MSYHLAAPLRRHRTTPYPSFLDSLRRADGNGYFNDVYDQHFSVPDSGRDSVGLRDNWRISPVGFTVYDQFSNLLI